MTVSSVKMKSCFRASKCCGVGTSSKGFSVGTRALLISDCEMAAGNASGGSGDIWAGADDENRNSAPTVTSFPVGNSAPGTPNQNTDFPDFTAQCCPRESSSVRTG